MKIVLDILLSLVRRCALPYLFKKIGALFMAKISLSPLVVDIRNKVADIVFSKWRGTNYVRSRVTPTNPNTDDQKATRNSLARVVDIWQALPAVIAAAWNYISSGKSYSGYNRFVGDNRADEEAANPLSVSPATDVSSLTSLSAATGSGANEIDITFAPSPVPAGKKLQVVARIPSLTTEKTVVTETFEIAAAQTSPQTLTMGEADTEYSVHACLSDDTLERAGKSLQDTATSHA
jgi:hypothetical protein